MAEIKIEQKTDLAVVVGWPYHRCIVCIFLVFRDNGENTEAVTEPEPITTNETDLLGIKENNDIVAAYVNFVENNKEKMSLDHAYTNEALSKLIEATNAIANEVGYDVQADIEKAKEYAKMISSDPFNNTCG
jgi:2',3'-cyclic-nucleotide 2'-phosphodiesterase (5'-nucleotidase family)